MAILVFPISRKASLKKKKKNKIYTMLNLETSMPLSDVKNSCLNLAKHYKPLQ